MKSGDCSDRRNSPGNYYFAVDPKAGKAGYGSGIKHSLQCGHLYLPDG